jgi:RNA polymerase sigma factor (TIGR02999 family)
MNIEQPVVMLFREGGTPTTDDIFPVVYDELRRLAQSKISAERSDQSLSATSLVHEAYLRLGGGSEGAKWKSREHFFAAAAEAMRRILIDRCRRRLAAKRGAGAAKLALVDVELAWHDSYEIMLQIDEMLDHLQASYPRQASVFKMRCFAGFSSSEIADALCISKRTVDVDWAFAKAWLADRLGNSLH